MEQSLLLIKPNVVKENKIGAVIASLEEKGVVVKDMKMETFTRDRAEGFYAIHRGKPFFEKLVTFMTSGPVVEIIAEHENCIEHVRNVIGSTDPSQAEPGTVRNRFGRNVTENAIHASDSLENATKEMVYIFGTV